MFDAEQKKGCAVGVQIVATDENGAKISDTESEWYGFTRADANKLTMALADGVEDTIAKLAGTAGKPGR